MIKRNLTRTAAEPRPPATSEEAQPIFERWLAQFGAAVERGDVPAVTGSFDEDGYWRDILTLEWGFATHSGRDEITGALARGLVAAAIRGVRPAKDRIAPRFAKRSGMVVVEAFFEFETAGGRSVGFVRLLPGSEGEMPTVWILLTALQELHGYEEKTGMRRPVGVDVPQDFAGPSWHDRRVDTARYADRDPEVLVVGAGQSGLSLAARLGQMGVDTLLVERGARVGDNWRSRYHALTLHNEVYANHLPYMPFPETWAAFLSKDQLAGWLEAYAGFMELNVWTKTEFVSGSFDDAAGRWTVTLLVDGEERRLQVPHLVLATGSVSGIPRVPSLPGVDEFAGEVLHSSEFGSGADYAGKNAIVVGTGNSGHDIAQDLYENGAQSVTFVQRGPTCVVSLVPSGTLVYELYTEGPVEDIDLITASIPYPVLRETYVWLTKTTCDLDRELLDGLTAVGFETDFGEDATGFHMKYLTTGGGYYIDVGCSRLIADRKIGLVNWRDAERFVPAGLCLEDGTVVDADLVVLATGYENQQETIRRLLGDHIAEKVGPIWGFGENQFMRNMWTRTGQEHLWIMGGALNECRLYSRFLALQLRAALDGLEPDRTEASG